jgi:outer membrane biosynthesis protein TonB
MKVQVPPTDYPAIQITVEQPDGMIQQAVIVSGTVREYEFALPMGIEAKQCGVFAELCNYRGQVDPITRPIVIQEAELGLEPEPESESVPDPHPEPESELKPEPEPEHRVDPKPEPEMSEEEHRVDPL